MPLKLTSELVSAYVAHNPVPANELPTLIRAVHHAFLSLANGEPEQTLLVEINTSVTREYLVCLEDGKRLKTLKRHLRSRYGMTPEAYRAKWKLPSDYPMTAPAYSARRSALARDIGLGQDSPQRESATAASRKARAASRRK